jgi:hypothetical protein
MSKIEEILKLFFTSIGLSNCQRKEFAKCDSFEIVHLSVDANSTQ